MKELYCANCAHLKWSKDGKYSGYCVVMNHKVVSWKYRCKDFLLTLLERRVRPELKIEFHSAEKVKGGWIPPFIRVYDDNSYLLELWQPDIEGMLELVKY